jgi:Cys-rich peptide (TIGR04165 family)
MKAEELCQKCPKCGGTDKSIGRTRKFDEAPDFLEIHITCAVPSGGSIGVIRCTNCGYIFNYCKENVKLDKLIKKININKISIFLEDTTGIFSKDNSWWLLGFM